VVDANDAREEVTQPIHISAESVGTIFGTARALHFFAMRCDSDAKNIANQGAKHLEYRGPDGAGACEYNWSPNPRLEQMTSLLQAMALTLDEGRTLARLHRYDRLGLDAEMGVLVNAVRSGDAAELGNIAPVLDSIAQDESVIGRVRVQARNLLAGVIPEQHN
jgi:hypothetical protein